MDVKNRKILPIGTKVLTKALAEVSYSADRLPKRRIIRRAIPPTRYWYVGYKIMYEGIISPLRRTTFDSLDPSEYDSPVLYDRTSVCVARLRLSLNGKEYHSFFYDLV